MEPTRVATPSAIPMVVGILMIAFASIGLLTTAVNLYGASRDEVVVHAPAFAKLTLMIGVLDILVGMLHLGAGIDAVRYRRKAPQRATMFAVARIVVEIGAMIAVLAIAKTEVSASVGWTIGIALAMCVWPARVLVLMRGADVRAACTR